MKETRLTIPMYPMNMVLFPGETSRLYIIEDRYRQLVDECMENDASFGILYSGMGKLSLYGSEVKISRVLKTYENGSMDILVECVNIFKLVGFSAVLRPKLYGAGIIETVRPQKIRMGQLQDAVVSYFSTVQNKLIDYETTSHLSIFSVASALQLSHAEKYRLLCASDPQQHLLSLLNFIVHIIHTEHSLKDRFIDN